MENKTSGKDYQPIRFHRGKPHLASPGKLDDEKDLNEDDPRRENRADKDDDSEVDKIDKEETTNEEKGREIEKSYEEEDESEKKERTRF